MESVGMEAVRRRDGDGGAEIVGDGGGGGGGAEVGAAPPGQPLTVLHPVTVSTKKHKERHIVAWIQQEDDLLREQVGIHGTENWTCIAAQFKDKTGRQCRRRWYSYVNSECKKGGWSPEEDMILCEAQKVFGNRWTEIAKMVSGRTDNAVKNRFTTLCKKRAKSEAVSQENDCYYPTSKTENFIHQSGVIAAMPSESSSTLKKIRYQLANLIENDNVLGQCKMDMEHLRPPLSVLVQNFDNVDGLLDHQHNANNPKDVQNDKWCGNGYLLAAPSFSNVHFFSHLNPDNAMNSKFQDSFLRRDNPKISAVMQQSELLSSLAQKVSTDCTEQSLENAQKELKSSLIQNGETGKASSDVSLVDFQLDVLVEHLGSSIKGSPLSRRQLDIHEDSRHNSECSNGSIPDSNVSADEKVLQNEQFSIQLDIKKKSLPEHVAQIGVSASQEAGLWGDSLDSISAAVMSPCEELKENDGIFLALPRADFSSPPQTMPLFRPFAEGVPSPKFSASERQFLLSALGLPSSSPILNNPSQQPSCKRALLNSL